MTVLSDILTVTSDAKKTIVLSEGTDSRVADAAIRACANGLAHIICIAAPQTISAPLVAAQNRGDLRIIHPETSPDLQRYAEAYALRRAHKGMSVDKAREELLEPHFFAAAMVANGDADGTIGGAVYPTPDIIRAALKVIGMAPSESLLSSFFFMIFPQNTLMPSTVNVFADCGLVIDPSAQELAEIAISSADSLQNLTHIQPKIAMLSFSTKGSAKHPMVSKVEQACALIRQKRPDLSVDGEVQFDAAILPDIGQHKAPGSDVAGQANLFVFPNLDAGNIGYKIAQRLGNARAVGPILQGLAKPANDLSRGCSVDDIIDMISVTVAQAAVRSA